MLHQYVRVVGRVLHISAAQRIVDFKTRSLSNAVPPSPRRLDAHNYLWHNLAVFSRMFARARSFVLQLFCYKIKCFEGLPKWMFMFAIRWYALLDK